MLDIFTETVSSNLNSEYNEKIDCNVRLEFKPTKLNAFFFINMTF